MKYSKFILLIFVGAVLSIGASEAKKAIEKRIAPVGSVCVQGQDCGTATEEVVAASSGGRNCLLYTSDAADD